MKMENVNGKLSRLILALCFAVLVEQAYSMSVDPILIHMCSIPNGAQFWRDFLECNTLLVPEVQIVLNVCIPISSPEEIERTRCSVCLRPSLWPRMMECMHRLLIEIQDETNPHLELSPNGVYKTCVYVLLSEAERSAYENVTFFSDEADGRNFTDDCSNIQL